jgi:hypothetical protein
MKAELTIVGDPLDPDRVYYNGSIINNSLITSQQEADPEIDYIDDRQQPMIRDRSVYELAVENFSLNGCQKSLPLFIPQIKSGSLNETIYTVSVGIYNGTNYSIGTTAINWVPENQASYIRVPPVNVVNKDAFEYYYAYSYTHFVSLINNALNRAWTQAVTGASGGCGTKCPFIEYDETTSLFSLNQDSKTCVVPIGTALPAPYSVTQGVTGSYKSGEYSFVGLNTSLELLLSNFPSIFTSGLTWGTGGPALPEVVIDTGLLIDLTTASAKNTTTPIGDAIKSVPRSSIVQLANPFTGAALDSFFLRLKQDYVSTGSVWSPISSIVLTTGEIMIINDAVSNPIILGTRTNGGQTPSGGAFSKILIETPIKDLDADGWRKSLVYKPLVPTFSSFEPSREAISTIDIKVYWRSRLTNSLIPMTIPNQSSMTFRILFKKKLAL